MYADCRPRAELYTDYSIDTIRHTGITTGNLCSSASHTPRPGVLVLYEIPKTYIPDVSDPTKQQSAPLRREPSPTSPTIAANATRTSDRTSRKNS